MKNLSSLLICLLCVLPLFGQNVEGSWNGRLETGLQKLRLVVHISGRDASYSGTIDSPDQGVKGTPLSTVHFNAPDLSFEVSQWGVTYKGTLQSDTLITGTFTQLGASFPLSLVKGEAVIHRPQEPKPPYPYNSEDVSFPSESPDVLLAGTLTTPQHGSGKFPAVILVSGSGPQNRDEEIFAHKPFLVIADFLTRNGIAVLRYDDRGYGKSTGTYKTATTKEFLSDALGAFNFLRSRNDIDPDKIGIIGHSEGGTIAFMAAAQNPEIACIISLAGMAVRGDSLLVQQNRDLMFAQGFSAGVVETYCTALGKVFDILKSETHEYIVQNKDRILPAVLSEEEAATLPVQLQQNLVNVLVTTPASPWMHCFLSLDPAQYIREIKCPVLALNGQLDLQVKAEINLRAIEEHLTAGGNRDYAIQEYKSLNHLFQTAVTGLPAEYGQIEETIAPAVLEKIKVWLAAVYKK